MISKKDFSNIKNGKERCLSASKFISPQDKSPKDILDFHDPIKFNNSFEFPNP
jgi:hypothetical protein